jgi:broad specificity phosphatase PhoE
MKLVAIRHGETEWNLEMREIGQLDSRLSKRGLLQAECIAKRLCKTPVDALYSSDLGRALQTAEVISSVCHLSITVDLGLRERHMGIFQGLTVAEWGERFPREKEEYERRNPEYVIPGGESARQRQERSVRALTAIAERHPDQSVVVVTHAGILTGFFEFVLGIRGRNGACFKKANCSYNSFEYSKGKWCSETWNDTSHLAGVGGLEDSRDA